MDRLDGTIGMPACHRRSLCGPSKRSLNHAPAGQRMGSGPKIRGSRKPFVTASPRNDTSAGMVKESFERTKPTISAIREIEGSGKGRPKSAAVMSRTTAAEDFGAVRSVFMTAVVAAQDVDDLPIIIASAICLADYSLVTAIRKTRGDRSFGLPTLDGLPFSSSRPMACPEGRSRRSRRVFPAPIGWPGRERS